MVYDEETDAATEGAGGQTASRSLCGWWRMGAGARVSLLIQVGGETLG